MHWFWLILLWRGWSLVLYKGRATTRSSSGEEEVLLH